MFELIEAYFRALTAYEEETSQLSCSSGSSFGTTFWNLMTARTAIWSMFRKKHPDPDMRLTIVFGAFGHYSNMASEVIQKRITALQS